MDNLAPEEKETLFYRELARYGVKRTDKLTLDNWGVVARVFNKLGIKSEIPNFEDIIAAGKRKNSMLRELRNTRKQKGGVITYIWEAVNVVVDSLGGWKNIILAGTVVAMGFAFVNGDRQPVVYNAPRPSPPPRPTINVNNTEDPGPLVPSPSRRGGYRKKRRQTKRKHRRH
jgi:hypothetical protein